MMFKSLEPSMPSVYHHLPCKSEFLSTPPSSEEVCHGCISKDMILEQLGNEAAQLEAKLAEAAHGTYNSGIGFEYDDNKIKWLVTESPPKGYCPLVSGWNVFVPVGWLETFLVRNRNKPPKTVIKRAMHSFLHASEYGVRGGLKQLKQDRKNGPLIKAIEAWANQKFIQKGVSATDVVRAINEKIAAGRNSLKHLH